MYDYIKYDPRYYNVKKQRRKVIFAWVQREFRNIIKAREAGCRVPMPIAIRNHVIVMELIGNAKTGQTAQRLKHAPPQKPETFFKEVIKNIKLLYHHAKLIHGDLSEYNILNDHESPVLIDFSQATPIDAANAEELLDRDVRNMVVYFRKYGVAMTAETLKKKITQPK